MKKVIAAVMALCIVGGTIPSARQYAPESIITASAADDEMTIVDGKLTSMPNKPNIVVPDTVTEIDCSVPEKVRTIYCPASVEKIRMSQYHNRHWSSDDNSSGNLKSVTVLNPDCIVSVTNYNSYQDFELTMPTSGYTGIIRQKGHEANGCYYPIGDASFSREGEIGDLITYKIDSSYNMTLSGKGTMKFKGIGTLGYGIESLSIGSGITCICGFEDFVELDTVKIADSVVVIGEQAFKGCTKLTALNIPKSVLSIEDEAFSDCSELSSFSLPEKLRSIGKNAFKGSGCKGALTIPASVKSIGEGAFANCSGLKSITISNPDCDLSGDILDSSFTGTVYGYAGSTAQVMAAKYGHEFVALSGQATDKPFIQFSPTLLGDANVDDQVNIADAVLVMQVATNPDKYAQGRTKNSISALGELNGDVDGVKGLSNADALLIQKYKLDKIKKFPVEE
ncbi:leucine-rich repeat protein [uncultured Ruminococcus sp.]|uniref:leucine-rich repeat protein n=1 Tax=uncultured Ruminococcus sp. TaxID=165186 RepID=UPI00261570E3|nr:leucine-rich repeat protein [uncultured Ruminococcus sp.]